MMNRQAALPSVSCHRERGCSRERGFSIIEVMVTVFILMLGLLGVGGLQYLSMKSNQSALSRAIATEYAYQMLDFIRSNPGVTTDRDDDLVVDSFCTGDMCNPDSFVIVKDDNDGQPGNMPDWIWDDFVEAWLDNLKRDLPDAWVSVCMSGSQDVTAGNLETCEDLDDWPRTDDPATPVVRYYVVTVEWKQAGTGTESWDLFTEAQQRIVLVGEVQ